MRGRLNKIKRPGPLHLFGCTRPTPRLALYYQTKSFLYFYTYVGAWLCRHTCAARRYIGYSFLASPRTLASFTFFLRLGVKARIRAISSLGYVKYCRSKFSTARIILISARRRYLAAMPSALYKFFYWYDLAHLTYRTRAKRPLARPRRAGFFFLLGRNPSVRGVAMNAVDHPNGGRTKSLRCARTPWARPARPR